MLRCTRSLKISTFWIFSLTFSKNQLWRKINIRFHISNISWGIYVSQIYNLTSDVTVMSIEMKPTPNLNVILARCSGKCAKFRFSILSCCDVIDADVKGGNYMSPQATGGWRGGPSATGLSLTVSTEQSVLVVMITLWLYRYHMIWLQSVRTKDTWPGLGMVLLHCFTSLKVWF